MADFFTNLAERTLGAAPSLQPLLSPTFGTSANAISSEPYALAEVEESISPQRSAPAPRRASEAAVENFEAHARTSPPVPAMPLVSPSPALPSPFLYQQEKKTRLELPPKLEDNITPEREALSPAPALRAVNVAAAISPPHAPQKLSEPPRRAEAQHVEVHAQKIFKHTEGLLVPREENHFAAATRAIAHEQDMPRSEPPRAEPLRRAEAQHVEVHAQKIFKHTESLLVPRDENRFAAATREIAHEQDIPRSESESSSPQRREAAGALRPLVFSEREYFSNRKEEREMTPRLPSPVPVIRVNIGRIEVRAVPPPVSAPSTRPRKRNGPALSLEEYLRQRNGSSR